MAKKKNNRAAKPKQTNNGDTVINHLFGSLESETDIESDIAQLGTEEEPVTVETKKHEKNRFFFVFAVFVIIMAIIGCVSTVRFAADFTANLVDNTSLKNEFAQFIFPVVINDTAPFESVSEMSNSSKITCAVWNILINKDTTAYEGENSQILTIPEYDVLASCKELFGSSVTLEHQTVGTAEVRFTYDEDNHVYSATKNTRYLTYAPKIVEMSESSGTYTLIVGYLPPTVASVAGIGMEVSPEKYMEYTINHWDGKDTLLSVRFSDYSPETDEN
jgi:hypothetical protein